MTDTNLNKIEKKQENSENYLDFISATEEARSVIKAKISSERCSDYGKHTYLDRSKTIIQSLDTIDKIYVNFSNNGSYLDISDEWKDLSASNKLIRTNNFKYVRDISHSFILNYEGITFVVLTNYNSFQFQFNLSKVTYPFVLEVITNLFSDQSGKISRLAVSVDVPYSFPFVLRNTRALRLRNCSAFADIPRGIKIDDEECIFRFSSERYGKYRQIQIYSKAKEARLLHLVPLTRVEINFDKNIPIHTVDEIPTLITKDVFDLVCFRLNREVVKLTAGERKSLDEFEKLQSDLKLSMTTGLQVFKKEHPSKKYDLLRKALKKTDGQFYDFNEAFKQNLELLISKPITEDEIKFLKKFKKEKKFSRRRDIYRRLEDSIAIKPTSCTHDSEKCLH